jgi:glycosyltransferase involved in cell wall biosynthesis
MENVISVIVPVYNVDKYLEECVDSILAQTYRELEIILVDDGSPDRSPAICDEYANRDQRVRVIHKKNGGAASAKNEALKIATGKYLTFVDSDDYLEPDALAYMQAKLEEYHAQVIQCSSQDIYTDRTESHIITPDIKQYETVDYLRRYTLDWTCGLHWAKLFYRQLFDGIYFEVGNKIDDEFFTYRGVMNATRVVCAPKIVYNYRQRKSSVMLSPASAQRIVLDRLSYLPQRRKAIISRFPELRRDFDLDFLNVMLFLAVSPFATEASFLRQKELLKEYRHERGATRPPRALWSGLLRLRFASVDRLMKKRNAADPAAESRCMFD